MSLPLFGPNNEALLRQIQQQRRQPQAATPASVPPPPDATATADAALFATQQLQQQNLLNQQAREGEAAQATTLLDEADRFDQNAQVAQQAAAESTQVAQQNREQANQVAAQHEQAEAAENQQLQAATEEARAADIARVVQDPAVLAQVKPDLAQAIGVDVKALDAEVETTFRSVQAIFAGQLDRNNERQVALAEKLESGKGFTTKEKIAVGMAALLPIIIGAATGNLGGGLAAASQTIGAISQQLEARQQQELTDRGSLEERELDIAERQLGLNTELVRQKGGVSNIFIQQEKEARDAVTQELKDQGVKVKNVSNFEAAKQAKVKTKADIIKFDQLLKDFQAGKLGVKEPRLTADQKKAATFASRMEASEITLTELYVEGWVPARLGSSLLQEQKSPKRQRFEQALSDFMNAFLRDQSGAVISDTEFAVGERDYFAMPGDSPELAQQKARSRAILLAGMKAAAGPRALQNLRGELKKLAPDLGIIIDPETFDIADFEAEQARFDAAIAATGPAGAAKVARAQALRQGGQ